jgi:hypothetical protein
MPDPLIMLIGGAIVAAFALGLGIGGWESPPPGTAEGVSAGTVERRVKMKEQTDAMERARDAAVRNIIRDGTKLETVCAEMGFDAGVAYAAALEAGKAVDEKDSPCEHRKGKMVGFDEETYEGSWKCKLCGEVFSRKAAIVCLDDVPPATVEAEIEAFVASQAANRDLRTVVDYIKAWEARKENRRTGDAG